MSSDNPLQNMQSRAEQCRRLAENMHDQKMRSQLLEWANEIEADVARLVAEFRSGESE